MISQSPPISTFAPMTEYAPTLQSAASLAESSTIAVGCINTVAELFRFTRRSFLTLRNQHATQSRFAGAFIAHVCDAFHLAGSAAPVGDGHFETHGVARNDGAAEL